MLDREHLDEDQLEEVFREAIKLVIAKKKLKGVPISRYDLETGRAYLEYPDGTIEYAED